LATSLKKWLILSPFAARLSDVFEAAARVGEKFGLIQRAAGASRPSSRTSAATCWKKTPAHASGCKEKNNSSIPNIKCLQHGY